MKTYVLTVSRVFPSKHKRKGEPTFFSEMILSGLKMHNKLVSTCFQKPPEKIHTIRSNYPLWAKRIKEVQEGKAVLSLRYWSGKPYNSKQVEFAVLDNDSGVGIQTILFVYDNINNPLVKCKQGTYEDVYLSTLSKNDGLSIEDLKEWFKKYDLSKPMAIIHFTKFRY